MGTHRVPTMLLPPPQVLWFEQQTVKSRAKRSVSVVPTDPWFPKQWYMVRFCCSPHLIPMSSSKSPALSISRANASRDETAGGSLKDVLHLLLCPS